MLKVVEYLLSKQDAKVLIHCRGGVGRAGTLACNILSVMCHFDKAEDVIAFVRSRRDKRCVESMKQVDFVKAYFKYAN